MPMPSPATRRHWGWFETASPKRNFGRERAVAEQPPIAADGPFQDPLPGLVEGLDEIDPPTFRLG